MNAQDPNESCRPPAGCNHTPKDILSLFAWVSVADDKHEGVVAMTMPVLGTMPMVGADLERMEQLRPMAQRAADLSGRPVVLARFLTRDNLVTLTPRSES